MEPRCDCSFLSTAFLITLSSLFQVYLAIRKYRCNYWCYQGVNSNSRAIEHGTEPITTLSLGLLILETLQEEKRLTEDMTFGWRPEAIYHRKEYLETITILPFIFKLAHTLHVTLCRIEGPRVRIPPKTPEWKLPCNTISRAQPSSHD